MGTVPSSSTSSPTSWRVKAPGSTSQRAGSFPSCAATSSGMDEGAVVDADHYYIKDADDVSAPMCDADVQANEFIDSSIDLFVTC